MIQCQYNEDYTGIFLMRNSTHLVNIA
jgi:hypothetical protein